MDDEAVRVAVGLRLEARPCEPHQGPCGAKLDLGDTRLAADAALED